MRILITLALCFFSILFFAQEKYNTSQIALQDINNLDSIIIDFANGSLVNNILSVPLYIKTDDDINALDFSFKFNEAKVELDTIIKQGSIEMTYFFNLNDRKLRLTSYSLSDYNTDKKILTIYFKILKNKLDNNDIFDILGLLNGDSCPIKITSKTFQVTNTVEEEASSKITIFPNPANHFINVLNAANYNVKICDTSGKILQSFKINTSHEHLSLVDLKPGLYSLYFETPEGILFSKSILKN